MLVAAASGCVRQRRGSARTGPGSVVTARGGRPQNGAPPRIFYSLLLFPADQARIFRPRAKSVSALVPSAAPQAASGFLPSVRGSQSPADGPTPTQASPPPSEGTTALLSCLIDLQQTPTLTRY